MPNNRKITDLPSIVPRSDLKFVVATDANNFSVSLGDISTSITDQLPADLIGQDDLVASGNFLHNYIDDINDALVSADNLLNLDLDSLSGALNTTESELQDKIDIISGDLFTTGQYLYNAIETVSGDLLASGTLIDRRL